MWHENYATLLSIKSNLSWKICFFNIFNLFRLQTTLELAKVLSPITNVETVIRFY